MYKKLLIFIIFILFGGQVLAQKFDNSISGYIFDSDSKEPLPGVNVYISNTLWGSSTGKDGHFLIESIPPGNHELVVSIIGYRMEIQIIRMEKDTNKKTKFLLKPIVYKTDAITVVADDMAEWYEDLNLLKDKFFGKTDFASQSTLKNEEVLTFNYDEGIFIAHANEPLLIINNALGYEIRCNLIAFEWLPGKNKVWWIVKNHFQELASSNEKTARQWEQNRKLTYERSEIHFFQWLMYAAFNGEYKITYYQQLPDHQLQPNQYHSISPDTLLKSGEAYNEFKLKFKDFLQITHTRNSETSYLRLTRHVVTLDEFGYPYEILPFEVYGYWATLGLANLLPKYYSPDN